MPATVAQALAAAASRHGARPALLGEGLALSHGQLDACVARAAAALARRGVAAGSLVGVSLPTGALHLVTLLALARAGACSVHLHPALPERARQRLAAQFGVQSVVGQAGTGAPLEADPSWLVPGRATDFADRGAAQAPWRLALSSGTTGLQKAVRVTHAMAVAEIAGAVAADPVAQDDAFLCHRGLDSNWSLSTALMHLAAGGSVVFPASPRAAQVVDAARRHRVTHLIMAPAFLRNLVDALPAGAGGLPGVRSLLVGGAAPPPALLAAALERVTPGVVTGYGTTELGLVTLAGPDLMRAAPYGAGRLRPGFEAEAVNEAGRPLPPGETGVLRFRRAGMAVEYYRHPEATARAFRDGWFQPGDLGSVDAGGLLTVGGRTDDKLNLDGAKIEPGPIERAFESHPAVAEAAVFVATPRRRARLYAALVLRSPAPPLALLAHCAARVGKSLTPRQIFVVRRLPRNEAGKLLRDELARRVKPRAP